MEDSNAEASISCREQSLRVETCVLLIAITHILDVSILGTCTVLFLLAIIYLY